VTGTLQNSVPVTICSKFPRFDIFTGLTLENPLKILETTGARATGPNPTKDDRSKA
jgi:hypothetical protein